jgi:CHAD domain-containing protein
MAQALERNSDEAFHEWRKEVKYLRYQLEALRTIAPEGLGSRITVLTDLGEVLGFEHDLTVLTNLIEADRRCGVTAAGLPAVLRARKEGLRGSAASRAQRAYAEEVDDFVAPIDDAWATARRAGVSASPG